jgi:polar amino acid transport system substrate-binding protein
MKRFLVSCVLIVFAIAAFAAPTEAKSASPTLDRIVERGELRVGMTGGQPPYNVKSKNGKLIGLEVDLGNLLGDAMNVKTSFVVKPFSELIPALQAGEVDVVMSGMTITAERNMTVAFVGPYSISGKSILTKSATLAAADDTDDINSDAVTLVALEGSTSQKFVEVLIPEAKLKKVPDYDAAVKAVLDDEAGAMVADIEICQLTMLRFPDSGLVTLDVPLTIEPIGIALPADDHLFINLMENYLAALEIVGIMDQLRADWFESGAWLVQLP